MRVYLFCFLLSFSVFAEKPNVLFIAIDDLRTELNGYGDTEVKTPNIDQFSGDAVIFDRSY